MHHLRRINNKGIVLDNRHVEPSERTNIDRPAGELMAVDHLLRGEICEQATAILHAENKENIYKKLTT